MDVLLGFSRNPHNVFLSNEITIGANHKFFTLTLNDLKAIAANQGNHVE